jgi:hypothetical protein
MGTTDAIRIERLAKVVTPAILTAPMVFFAAAKFVLRIKIAYCNFYHAKQLC